MITSLSRKNEKGRKKGKKGKEKKEKGKFSRVPIFTRKMGGGKKWFSKLIYTPVFDLVGVYYQMVTPRLVSV